MGPIRIEGGRALIGTIGVGGTKNAALPLMAGSLDQRHRNGFER